MLLQLQITVLDRENPDLVVYGGDMVSGWYGREKNGWFEEHWIRITETVRSRGIQYAFMLGNHDDEADLNRRQIVELDNTIGGNLSLTQNGPMNITGATNYFIDVRAYGESRAAARLWFLDSMDRGCENVTSSWGCVGLDTVAWFSQQAKALPVATVSMVFVHIPLPELRLAWGDPWSRGVRQEFSACPSVNTHVLQAAADSNIHAVFSAHDHKNDYIGRVHKNMATGNFTAGPGYGFSSDPILMGYGMKSGYGSYGPGNITHGARVMQLWQDRSVFSMDTWITNSQGYREFQPVSLFKGEIQPACGSSCMPSLAPVILVLLCIIFYF